jgi:hypothetical protein
MPRGVVHSNLDRLLYMQAVPVQSGLFDGPHHDFLPNIDPIWYARTCATRSPGSTIVCDVRRQIVLACEAAL